MPVYCPFSGSFLQSNHSKPIIFSCMCPFYSALDLTLLCVILPAAFLMHFHLAPALLSFSNRLRHCLQKVFPGFLGLGSGSAFLQMSHPEQQSSISLCSEHWQSDSDCFPFCLQPLLIKCEVLLLCCCFFPEEALCFHLYFFGMYLVHGWCAISESKMNR